MLFTLHRYIFKELFRVFLLASVGLTLILSLGSILQPVQEFGLGSRQVFHLMGYFLPITLTFVLPMAALFAGALVYGRFASDNEFDACRATGISVPTLIYPGLALAIIVSIANLLLSFYVMPVFVHRAEESLRADAKKILFRNIERKKYYALPPERQYLIYADQANYASGILSGVIVAKMVGYNNIESITTAEYAKIHFDPHDRFNEVRIEAYKPRTIGETTEAKAEWIPFIFEFGSMLGDDIKFKKINEMKSIQADLVQFYPIEKMARETYDQLILELLAQDINTKLKVPASSPDDEQNNFYRLIGEPDSVMFKADRCAIRDAQIELTGNIIVKKYQNEGGSVRTLQCKEAWISLEDNIIPPTLTLDLDKPEVVDESEVSLRDVIKGLIPPQTVEERASKFKKSNGALIPEKLARELLELSDLKPSNQLSNSQGTLEREIRKTLVEIKSEIHSRLVFGTGCIPMILIGIGLGIIKKGGHLLTAFGASCVPAAVLVICIMSGKQLTENLGSANMISGLAIMWAGLGFLVLVTLIIYGHLMKN